MESFLLKKNSFKISEISNKEFCRFSLCPQDYKKLVINSNVVKLKDVLIDKYKGVEIGSENYMKCSNYRFLKTVNITNKFIYNQSTIEYCKPFLGHKPQKNDILIVKDGAGNGLGEVALYKNENINNDFISAGLIGVNIEKEKKYYVFGMLKSQHFKDFININTAQGSTIRHSKLIAFEYEIPFPTIKNHKNPALIEQYVSLLTQNIIDKEEQIEKKLNQINSIIENELKNSLFNFKFSYPKKSELLNKDFRLDTGLYKSEYKSIVEAIKGYEKGFSRLADINNIKWISGSTPSALIETNLKTDKLWIAVADINYGLTYKRLKSFKLLDNINTVQDGDILITRKGATVGKMIIYFDTGYKEAFVNEDLKVLRLGQKMDEKIFIGLFLNSKFGQVQMLSNGSKGTKQGLTNPNILSVVIPNFSEELKSNLAKLYYNDVKETNEIDLKVYLDNEKLRNEKLGISNLNLECFKLVEKLENIIQKIIREEQITIE